VWRAVRWGFSYRFRASGSQWRHGFLRPLEVLLHDIGQAVASKLARTPAARSGRLRRDPSSFGRQHPPTPGDSRSFRRGRRGGVLTPSRPGRAWFGRGWRPRLGQQPWPRNVQAGLTVGLFLSPGRGTRQHRLLERTADGISGKEAVRAEVLPRSPARLSGIAARPALRPMARTVRRARPPAPGGRRALRQGYSPGRCARVTRLEGRTAQPPSPTAAPSSCSWVPWSC
jgi:hypothetical protein